MPTISSLPGVTTPAATDLFIGQQTDGITVNYTPAQIAAGMGLQGAAYIPAGGPNGAAVLDGSGNASPFLSLSTGTTTARSLAARGADWINVKDFGAVLNGVTDDSTAIASAYAATPANGIIKVPSGGWELASFPTVTGAKLWQLTGNTYGTGSQPVFNTGDDTLETILTGQRAWARTATLSTTKGPLRSDFTLNSTSPGSISSNIQLNGYVLQNPTSVGVYGLWNVNSVLTVEGIDASSGNAQHVGVASSVFIKNKSAPLTWGMYSQVWDQSGFGNNLISGEFDLTTNGPDGAATNYNPGVGGRVGFHFAGNINNPGPWPGAGIAVSLGSLIYATVSGTAYVFVCTTAGTTGSTQPTWTSSGTFTDGTVIWTAGATVNAQVSRCIDISGVPGFSWGSAIFTEATYYNAILDFSFATLAAYGGSLPAAIRLKANMPIDFSADGALAGQNVRTILYNSTSGDLEYQKSGSAIFSISDFGAVTSKPGASSIGFLVSGTSGSGGFDTSTATLSAFAFRMAQNQVFVLEASNTYGFSFSDSSGSLSFTNTGTQKFAINLGNGQIVPTGLYIDASTQTVAPVAAATVNLSNNAATVFINPAGTLATLTVASATAPTGTSGAATMQKIIFNQAVTVVTWTNQGAAGYGGAALPTSVAKGAIVYLEYVQSINTWVHVLPV